MGESKKRRTILFVVGDLSGDEHISRLAARLAKRHPEYVLHALGGTRLGKTVQKTGGRWIADTTNCSCIGLVSGLPILVRTRWLQLLLRRFVRTHAIDAVVLWDWGGFNCAQLKFFNKAHLPVLYYSPPRSWQRTGKAGLQFAPLVDRVATPFEWSAARLKTTGCRADWVGHPLLESKPEERSRESLREEFGVTPGETLVALFPGSRPSELRVLGPRLVAVAAILARKGSMRFVVPVPAALVNRARSCFPLSISVLAERATEALRACDAAVVKTGSCTLDAVIAGAPQVTFYDVSLLGKVEWVFLWAWKRIPFIAMPNIILQRKLVPEFLGLHCRPEAIAEAVQGLLADGEARQTMEAGYREIREHLRGRNPTQGATDSTLEILEEMLEESARSDRESSDLGASQREQDRVPEQAGLTPR